MFSTQFSCFLLIVSFLALIQAGMAESLLQDTIDHALAEGGGSNLAADMAAAPCNNSNLGPCDCPKGFTLIGVLDDSGEQVWQCQKFSPNCNVECVGASTGFKGFCQSNFVIAKPKCKVPACYFEGLLQRSNVNIGPGSSDVWLSKDRNGWYAILANTFLTELGCGLCRGGEPICMKRVPYYAYIQSGDD